MLFMMRGADQGSGMSHGNGHSPAKREDSPAQHDSTGR
jgi:hypothetical protein